VEARSNGEGEGGGERGVALRLAESRDGGRSAVRHPLRMVSARRAAWTGGSLVTMAGGLVDRWLQWWWAVACIRYALSFSLEYVAVGSAGGAGVCLGLMVPSTLESGRMVSPGSTGSR
jgi:hypothetical protein